MSYPQSAWAGGTWDIVPAASSGRRGPARGRPADVLWRLAYRALFPMARAWWHLSRPHHEGALVAIWVGSALLLVRSSYRAEWNFPGGGLRRGEPPEEAARRELAEEVGLVGGTLVPAGELSGLWDGRHDRVHFFELRLEQPPELEFDGREIVGARLVSADDLRRIPLTGPVAAYLAARTEGRKDGAA